MIGWAIYPTPEKGKDNAFDWMIESAAKYGISLNILFAEKFSVSVGENNIEIWYDGEELSLPHFVLIRHYDDELSKTLESVGVRVVNDAASMRLSQNKYLTHIALSQRNIPTPRTLFRVNDYEKNVAKLGLPFVLKAIRGSKGMEVYLISNEQEFEAVKNNHDFITQRYISTSYGRDIRLWVIGGSVVASVLRVNDKSFKSNIALGARAEQFPITPTIEHLAVESCKALGLELAGVDILFDSDGYTVCEVNGNAGFRAFSMAEEEIDIPSLIFKYITKIDSSKK